METNANSVNTDPINTIKFKYDWQAIMNYKTTNTWWPGRRMTIHAIATIVERDPLVVLKEMEKSNLCCGTICPDVMSPVFWLKDNIRLGACSYDRTQDAFVEAKKYLEKYPIDKVKGFGYRKSTDTVTFNINPMSDPFESKDEAYKKGLIEALLAFRKDSKV